MLNDTIIQEQVSISQCGLLGNTGEQSVNPTIDTQLEPPPRPKEEVMMDMYLSRNNLIAATPKVKGKGRNK